MTPDNDKTLGEISRSVDRIETAVSELRADVRDRTHKLANDMHAMVAPLSALGIRMDVAERNIGELHTKVEGIEVKSAAIAGGIGVIAYILQFVPSWIKGGH